MKKYINATFAAILLAFALDVIFPTPSVKSVPAPIVFVLPENVPDGTMLTFKTTAAEPWIVVSSYGVWCDNADDAKCIEAQKKAAQKSRIMTHAASRHRHGMVGKLMF